MLKSNKQPIDWSDIKFISGGADMTPTDSGQIMGLILFFTTIAQQKTIWSPREEETVED